MDISCCIILILTGADLCVASVCTLLIELKFEISGLKCTAVKYLLCVDDGAALCMHIDIREFHASLCIPDSCLKPSVCIAYINYDLYSVCIISCHSFIIKGLLSYQIVILSGLIVFDILEGKGKFARVRISCPYALRHGDGLCIQRDIRSSKCLSALMTRKSAVFILLVQII